MPDYNNLYGEYNPYSATNLQGTGGLMGGTTPFERVILESQANGQDYSNVTADGYSPNSYGLAGNIGGALGEQRALSSLGVGFGDVANMAKGAVTGQGLNPASKLGDIPAAMYSSAGIEKPAGFWGGVASKVPGVIGGALLGPVGGLMGSMVGTPFADMVGDAFDTRQYENIQDETEDKFGQIGGRRAFADLKDSVTEQSILGAQNLQAAIDSMNSRAQMQVGTPEQMAANVRDAAQLQAFQNAQVQQRPQHNYGIDPFGGMSAQMQANLADKYGTGWTRDENFNIVGGSGGNSGGGGYNNSENTGAGGQTGGDKDGGRY